MALSLGQLLTPVTEEQALKLCLEILQELGFPVTAWQAGRVQHTSVRLVARLYSELTNVIAAFTSSGFPRLAVGSFADLLGKHLFDEDRIPAEETEGYVHLVSDLSSPSLTLDAGALRIKIAGKSFVSAETLSLSPGGTVDLLMRAEIAGADSNVAVGSVCTFVAPDVVGVTMTNPIYADGTWITTQGTDAESDDRYMSRCVGKIARQAYGNTEGAYRAWTLEALAVVNRVTVQQGAGDGEIEITAATAEGALTSPQIDTIVDYLDGVTDGVGRRPINDVVTVGTVTEVTSPALTLTVYVRRAYSATASDLITEQLEDYLENLPIGGEVISAPPGAALQSAMIARVMGVTGVVKVTGVPADVSLASDEVYAPAISLTIVEV
jgi:uncharacterized phage protein gp47/JayE